MENVNFQSSGEDIERALMDLGVSIKEETPEEAPDPAVLAQPNNNVLEGVAGGSSTAGTPGAEGEKDPAADSLASPSGARAPPSAARCVVCTAPLALADGTPKLMECLHSICEPCLKAKLEEKASSRDFLGAERITIMCPQCRLQCQPANMIDQRFVLEKIAADQNGSNGNVSGEQQCNSCEDTEPATSYCVDCAEFICDNCVHAHQRLKITKDHTIKSREEALAELGAAPGSSRGSHDIYCREHTQERLTLFCETCDRLTCRDCQLQHHRDHKYQFSTEMAHQARANIASLLSEVSYKRVLLGSAMKVIRDRQQLIADKKKALVHEITQTVVKLTNAINTRGKQLVLRLNEVCDAKQRTLTEKKDALAQLAAITDHCVEFVSSALEHGSDTALLHAKPAVTHHLQRIKSRRADIPNPEIPVRITLALDKLPDLIRVLSSIGAIVVDGKVDGGAGGSAGGGGSGAGGGGSAQGPYHPPAPAPAPPSPHNAVVALHHAAAMHQSYMPGMSSGGGGGGGGGTPPALGYLPLGGALRARAHTPLRHAHVTSTTHPHHLHGMNELNLRGLLNAAGARAQRPQVHPHHAYHQGQYIANVMGAYATNAAYAANAAACAANAGGAGGRRSGGPRTPSPAPAPPAYHHHQHHHQQQQQQAKWHIPQHGLSNGSFEVSGGGGGGSDFKITLGRQHTASGAAAGTGAGTARPALVTSTNPKTPSPSLNGGVSLELDKVCADSVQDLMATIAKLDSNGVQVVAEAESPAAVHSSTDGGPLAGAAAVAQAAPAAAAPGDPNEDWCAVCMDGGELMCCDKCPKVFHQYCHIPTIEKLPDETETWQCLLCVNFAELPVSPGDESPPMGGGLPPRVQKLVERVTLELYCQYEPSLAFREPVPASNVHYHAKVARPMCLDMIRMKLQPRSPQRYTHVAQFVADVRLLFRNAYHYNPADSQIYKDAKRLEEFFDGALLKWLPEYAYWCGEGTPPHKRARID